MEKMYLQMNINQAFLAAVKYKKLNVLDFLMKLDAVIDEDVLKKCLLKASDADHPIMLEKLLMYAERHGCLSALININNIHELLRNGPEHCIVIMIEKLVDASIVSYAEFFTAIAKAGNLACAKAFINHIKESGLTEIEKNKLIINCILQGFYHKHLILMRQKLTVLHKFLIFIMKW
jgi:hypothetical protein